MNATIPTAAAPVVYRVVRTDLGEMRVVTYTGSLTAQHGEYWQLEVCDCEDCDAAFQRWEFGEQIDAPDTRWVLLPADGDPNTRWARRDPLAI
jgi:hypothetical protein